MDCQFDHGISPFSGCPSTFSVGTTNVSGSPPIFSVTTRTEGADLVVVALGELDIAGAPAIRKLIADSATSGRERVVVDLSGVTFIDGAGLGGLLAEPRRKGVEVVLRAPSPPVERLLELIDGDSVDRLRHPRGRDTRHRTASNRRIQIESR
jgi:anti-sigma B factor antagonist